MNIKVVYFTRTGTSRRIAEKIASELSCDVVEIRDDMKWKGIFGFIKGGYYASKDKPVKIKLSKEIGDYDELVVVSPLWAGGSAPAIRTFLKNISLEKVNLVITSNGSSVKDRSGYKCVNDIIKSKSNEETVIGDLVKKIMI
ncbi:MAG: hypothetical protein WBA54_05135 [Acidaminobacteraceae bacterium]